MATLHTMMKFCCTEKATPVWLLNLVQSVPITIVQTDRERAFVKGVASVLRTQTVTRLSYLELSNNFARLSHAKPGVEAFKDMLTKELPSLNSETLDVAGLVMVATRVSAVTLQFLFEFSSSHSWNRDLVPMKWWKKNREFLLEGAKNSSNQGFTERAQQLTFQRICEELLKAQDEEEPMMWSQVSESRKKKLRDLSMTFCTAPVDRQPDEMKAWGVLERVHCTHACSDAGQLAI